MSRHLWTLYDVSCPFCGAGFSEPCRVASGPHKGTPIASSFHVKRRVAFRNALAARPSGQ